MKSIILIGLALIIAGCGAPPRAPDTRPLPVDVVAEATIAAKQKQIEDGQAEISRLRGDNGNASLTLADVKGKLAKNAEIAEALRMSNLELQAEGKRIVVENRQSKLHWLAGILGFVAVGLGVAAWFSPVYRLTLVKASAGCAAFGTILLFVARWAAYFELIGAGLLVGTAILLLVMWRNKAHAIQVLATHFTSYADKLGALAPEVRAEMDRVSRAVQPPAVRVIVDKALETVKAPI